MKKLMFAVAAIAAGIAVADVTSANVVGYLNKAASDGAQFYYLTSPIRNVGNDTGNIDIQKFQMDTATANKSTDLQVLDGDGFSVEYYTWFKANKAAEDYGIEVPAGANGVWTIYDEDHDTATLATRTFKPGDSFQLYTKKDKVMTFSGQVSDTDISFTAKDGAQFYYLGNPFAADISIQNVQMDTTVANKSTDLQVLDGDGFSVEYYTWFKANKAAEDYGIEVPAGANGVWTIYDEDNDTATLATRTFKPGEGFQLYTKKDKTATIYAPYDL